MHLVFRISWYQLRTKYKKTNGWRQPRAGRLLMAGMVRFRSGSVPRVELLLDLVLFGELASNADLGATGFGTPSGTNLGGSALAELGDKLSATLRDACGTLS